MAHLTHLRQLMQQESISAYIIPTDDAHQSEYIAECDKRRQFISGFTGSAGIAIVTEGQALLWTDGRYHLQASTELDLTVWTLMRQGNPGVPSPEEWLASNISDGRIVGFDPNITSHSTFLKHSEAMQSGCGGKLQEMDYNLVDKVWGDSRPPPSNNALMILGVEHCGQLWQDKVKTIRSTMQEYRASILIITALDEVAWLFNLRGTDVDYNPVFFSYAIITLDDVRLYISEEKTTTTVLEYLQGVNLLLYSQITRDLKELVKKSDSASKIWISKQSSHALVKCVPKSQLMTLISPIQMLKGVKNETEIQGMRECQVRDSAAVCEYLHWLENEVPNGELNEVTAADRLENIRKELPNFVSLSFPTISSSGPNGAIIHYRPDPDTARKLSINELYLCDSGAQYLDGTTDITRTVTFGEPSHKEKECFTAVLKGHIALCSAIFPANTMGNQLDYLARHALWELGLDYNHGTGHGVGSFLNVHEGPHGISKTRPYSKPLHNGMFVTDEPGYYEDGCFGVRIENVELIRSAKTKYSDIKYSTMESLTLVPIQLKMIEISLLTKKEVDWLNDYHATCWRIVGQWLKEKGKSDVVQWLQRETQPILF